MCMLNTLMHQSSMQELDLLNPQLDPRITFSRASSKTYFGGDGLLHTAAADEWPLEYDPITLKPIGRSVWEQRTNLVLRSQEFDNSTAWSLTNITVTPNGAIAPDGTPTADILTATTTGSTTARDTAGTTATATSMAYSVYTKKGTSTTARFLLRNDTTATNFNGGVFNYDTGTISGTGWTVESVGNGWYRLTYVRTTGITVGDVLRCYIGAIGSTLNAGDSWLVWGAQLEAGTFATSYIPTAGSQVTRAADSATVLDLAALRFNAASGSLLVKGRAPASVASAATLASYNDNTGNEVIRLHMEAGGALKAQAIDGGTTVADLSLGTLTAGQEVRAAIGFAENRIAGCLNGGTVQTDASATLPTVDRLMIGRGVAGNYWNSSISVLRAYPERLSNSELQALTA